ncbi:MAG TPA: HEAT repeat domain-containing protein [Planctomycetota bacterium]|nr:HEAT repeat domain-containing protein [Planctomycetota bacterium]
MHGILPTVLCALAALVGLPALLADIRGGLRYGWGTTQSGCAPGPCGCLLVIAGALFGAGWALFDAEGPPVLTHALAGATGVWLLHAAIWRAAAACGSTRGASLRQAKSSDALARRCSVERLAERRGARSDREIRGAILDNLEHDDLRVVEAAALGAVRIDAAAVAVEALRRQLLRDRAWAAGPLVQIGRPAVGMLLTLLERGEGSRTARCAALSALGSIGDSRGLPHLLKGLSDPQEDVRTAAAAAAWGIRDRALLQPLRDLLDDASPEIRGAAVTSFAALAREFKEDVLEEVAALLDDPVPATRASAAIALGNLFRKEAVPLLVPLLQSPDRRLRRAASSALHRLEWSPSTDEERAFDAVAQERWDVLADVPEAAAAALLLAARDPADGQTAVAQLEALVRTRGETLSPAALERLAALDGVVQTEPRDMGYGAPVECAPLRALARRALDRRLPRRRP